MAVNDPQPWTEKEFIAALRAAGWKRERGAAGPRPAGDRPTPASRARCV